MIALMVGLGACQHDTLGAVELSVGVVWSDRPVTVAVSGLVVGEVVQIVWSDARSEHRLPPIVADAPRIATRAVVSAVGDTVWFEAIVGSRRSARIARPLARPGRVLDADHTIATTAEVEAIAGYVGVSGDLSVEATDLTELILPDLAWVGGDVRIWSNPGLRRLELPALGEVQGDLSLYDNPTLASPVGLDALQQVGGTLAITRMPAMSDLTGLASVRHLGALYLYHDVALMDLDALQGLQTVATTVDLWELDALQSVELPALRSIGGKLDLFECDALVRLDLPALTSLGSYELHHCDAMSDLGDLPQIEALAGELRIQHNDGLVSLDGLPQLTSVGTATWRHNPALQSLAGLSGLASVDGLLQVRDDDALTVLDLPALAEVGRLEVFGHQLLADPGLPALQRADGVSFHGNPLLSQCVLEAWLGPIAVGDVECYANLDDGCTEWCTGGDP